MAPVNTYLDGVYSQVKAVNNSSNDMSVNLFYRVNQLDETLINSGLKYTVVSSSTPNGEYTEVTTGDFTNIKSNEIVILNEKITSNTTQYYRVYIWFDNSAGNQVAVQNTTLDVELNGMVNLFPNKPVLDYGMIPVVISNDGTVTTVSEDDPDWYNYRKKEWANIVLVSSSSRGTYLNTEDVVVNQSDILGWYDVTEIGNVSIDARTDTEYNYKTILNEAYPGVTYTITMDSAVLNSGNATQFEARIYDDTTSETLQKIFVNLGDNISVTLKYPEGIPSTNDLGILIYAGVSGSTSGNAVTFNNVKIGSMGSTNGTKYTSSSINNLSDNVQLFAHWEHKPEIITLYSSGNEYTDITGGWVGLSEAYSSDVTKGSTYLEMSAYKSSVFGGYYYTKKIDLTNYNTLKVTFTSVTNGRLYLAIDEITNEDLASKLVKYYYSEVGASGTLTLDISSYSGSYYVILIGGIGYNGITRTVRATKVEMLM